MEERPPGVVIRVATRHSVGGGAELGGVELTVLLPEGLLFTRDVAKTLAFELMAAARSSSFSLAPLPSPHTPLPLLPSSTTEYPVSIEDKSTYTDSVTPETLTSAVSISTRRVDSTVAVREGDLPTHADAQVQEETGDMGGTGKTGSTAPSPHGDGLRVQGADVDVEDLPWDGASTELTPVLPAGTIPPQPDYAFQGRSVPDRRGESLAPRSCIIGPNAYRKAQEMGFRGSEEWHAQTVEACLDYFRGTGKPHVDWQATVRTWLRGSVRRREDLPPGTIGNNGQAVAQQYQRDAQRGLQGGNDGPRPRSGYGYDRNGNATNRATSQRDEIAKLDALLRQRAGSEPDGVGDDPGPDAITLDPDEWRGV